ncbi:MAG: hypothetical protein HIU93_05235 [Acidobacteria bacterium]|nr:hypothetical protein [Acidobacteriota bacterium]
MIRSNRIPSVLFDAMERGALVITANARAARVLHQAYAATQQSQGYQAWTTPSVQDWQSWTADLWRQAFYTYPDLPLLLDTQQERVLWKRIQQREAVAVVSPDSLAHLSQQAYALLSRYCAHDQRRQPWTTLDSEHFRSWAAAFDAECSRRGWASSSRCDELLASLVEEGRIPAPAELLCTGFDRLLPSQQRLLDALHARGTLLGDLDSETPPGSRTLIYANELREEITACATWCREQLASDPSLRIGILVPDLKSVQPAIDRIFRSILNPRDTSILAAASRPPYEFSLGSPLASVPVVRSALLLLKWLTTPLPEEEATWLLLSGFLATSDGEALTLAALDARWRDTGALSPELPLETARRKLSSAAPAVAQRLLQTLRLVQERPRRWSEWTELAPQLLEAAGWPGHRTPDSAQYQAQQRLDHLFDQLAALDFDASQTTFRDFVRTLTAQASETIFSLESYDAPIQVMGAMEASGQRFDTLWFLGIDDQAWPLRGRAHPLLPAALQRKHNMPHASPQQEWELAHAVTLRIAASAPVCVFSYSRQAASGESRCSPLLSSLVATEPKPATAFLQQPRGASAVSLETIPDDSGVLTWPQQRTAGGSEVLKRQAACPFQAFAMGRLHTAVLNRTERGFTAAERGKLLHQALEQLWSAGFTTRDQLINATATGSLASLLQSAVAAIFAPYSREAAGDNWMLTYLEGEQQRLITLLGHWLAIEAQRGLFTVEHVEKRLDNIDISGLRLNLRADRVDRLPEGGHFLIDYKTSLVTSNAWQGERPDEPQLPVYALFGGIDDLQGVLFAQLRANACKFEGLIAAETNTHFAALPKDIAKIGDIYGDTGPEAWESALLNLAADFLHGEAAVNPLHGAKTCRYCALPGLCRVAELQALTEEDNDDDEG